MKEIIRKNLVQIKKFVKPDIEIIEMRETYSGQEYYLMSFVFSDNLVVEQKCDEDGEVNRFSEVVYYGAKLEKDLVITAHPKYGWIVHNEATELLHNNIAEKELLK